MSRVSGQPYFVYVLWSASARRFHIGIAASPTDRLAQHNSSNHRSWTAKYRPWTLVKIEEYGDYTTARMRELELKAQKGGRGFFEKTGLDPATFDRRS